MFVVALFLLSLCIFVSFSIVATPCIVVHCVLLSFLLKQVVVITMQRLCAWVIVGVRLNKNGIKMLIKRSTNVRCETLSI